MCELLGSFFLLLSLLVYRCFFSAFPFAQSLDSPRLRLFGISLCFECVESVNRLHHICAHVCIQWTKCWHFSWWNTVVVAVVKQPDTFFAGCCTIDFICILSSIYYSKDKVLDCTFACKRSRTKKKRFKNPWSWYIVNWQRKNITKWKIQHRMGREDLRTNILLSVQYASQACMNEASTAMATRGWTKKLELKNREREIDQRAEWTVIAMGAYIHRVPLTSTSLLFFFFVPIWRSHTCIMFSRYCSDLSEIVVCVSLHSLIKTRTAKIYTYTHCLHHCHFTLFLHACTEDLPSVFIIV